MSSIFSLWLFLAVHQVPAIDCTRAHSARWCFIPTKQKTNMPSCASAPSQTLHSQCDGLLRWTTAAHQKKRTSKLLCVSLKETIQPKNKNNKQTDPAIKKKNSGRRVVVWGMACMLQHEVVAGVGCFVRHDFYNDNGFHIFQKEGGGRCGGNKRTKREVWRPLNLLPLRHKQCRRGRQLRDVFSASLWATAVQQK